MQNESVSLLVSTSRRRRAKAWSRARQVAQQCNGTLVSPNGSVKERIEKYGASALYVVTDKREELRDSQGQSIFVHPGLFGARTKEGRRHPMIRALRGDADVTTDSLHVTDCTLGFAVDALVAAEVLHATVIGYEKSPVMQCLLESGLQRMANEGKIWSNAATRVQLRKSCAFELLENAAPKITDVVYLDPMMRHRRPSSPGYALFRQFSSHQKFTKDHLRAAAQVARQRVVMKIAARRQILPDGLTWHQRISGAAVDYLVHECGE